MTDPDKTLSESAHVSRAAGTVGFFTLLSRILGLVRDVVFARYFGSGMAADAFFVAFRIPNLLRRLFAEGSLTVAFIPVFTEYLNQQSKEDAFRVAGAVLSLLTLLLTVITILGILFSPWIVRIQAFGFGGTGDKYELTVLLTRIMFPYIFFVSLVALFMGILNSLRHFAAPAAAPIFLNIGIIGAVLWISPALSQPIVGVAIGVLIGGIMQILLQLPWIFRQGLSLAPVWMPQHAAVKRIGLLMLPAIYGSSIYTLNQVIGTLLASFLPEGSVSWLYYADRIVEFPLGVFAIAISTAALPSLSKQAAQNAMQDFADTLRHALGLTFFITLPSMAGMIILQDPIVRLFFERGAFDSHATQMTARALAYYTVGLWAFSGIRVMVSGFYAVQDPRTPVKVATVAIVANALLSLLLMGPMKHGGLALSLSLASSLQFILLVYFLKKRVPHLDLRSVGASVAKHLVSSVLMGVVIYLSSEWLDLKVPSDGLSLALGLTTVILIGVVTYFLIAALLGCRELASLKDMLRPLFRKNGAP